MKTNIFFIFFILFFAAVTANAQILSLQTDLQFQYPNGIITFELPQQKNNKKYNVKIFCSTDDEKSYTDITNEVTGDAGKNVTAGKKTVYWNPFLKNPDFNEEVKVKVNAKVVADLPSNFVLIDGGTFTMGSPESEPERGSGEKQHQVRVSSFYISKYEVSVAEFKEFIDATGYKTDADKRTNNYGSYVYKNGSWNQQDGVNWRCGVDGNVRPASENNHPVIHISWNDCVAYCNWKSERDGLTKCYTINGSDVTCDFTANGYRLPTEAEWEYAARAGSTTPFSTGNNLTTSQANYDGNYPYNGNSNGKYREKTVSVSSFSPNNWGLYNVHGNVWEWCWDWYGDDSINGLQTNPIGATTGQRRLLRGGSWFNSARSCCSANRLNFTPTSRNFNVGFRLVLFSAVLQK